MQKVPEFISIGLGLKPDICPRYARTVRLSWVLLVYWLAFGSVTIPALVGYFGRMDISLDGIYRAVPLSDTSSLPVIPLTIIDIDELSWNAWQRPAATPRDALAKIVQRAVDAGAMAIVVDIDLSGSGHPDQQQPDAFHAYLEAYPPYFPPLVFPKRLVTGSSGLLPAPSSFDDLIGVRDNLAWADATLDSDGDGVIRNWSLWREVCSDEGKTVILPSILARLSSMIVVPAGKPALPTLPPPNLTGNCSAEPAAASPRILFKRLPNREPLTGSGNVQSSDRLAVVPARLVVNDDIARDDAALFGGRVVFVGASHLASRDFHRTTHGDLPGVEILAQQVHLAPLANLTSVGSGLGIKIGVGLLFSLLVAIEVFLKRGQALLQVLVLVVAGWVGVGILRSLVTYEVIANAVVLMIALVGLRAVFELVEDSRHRTPDSPFLLDSRPWRKVP